jgi:transposase
MVKAYSEDLRKRVIEARERGQSAAVVARRFRLNVRTVERYGKRYRETGQIASKKHGGYRRSRLEGHEKMLQRWIGQQADLTLAQLQQRCREQLKVRIGINALWHRLDRLGLSYKKNDVRRRARAARRQGRPKPLAP